MSYLVAKGKWACLACGWQCAPGPAEDETLLTCGQRESRLCVPCDDYQNFEFTLVRSSSSSSNNRPQPQGHPTASHNAAAAVSAMLPVAHVVHPAPSTADGGMPPVPVGTVLTADLQRRQMPTTDELSTLTSVQLLELKSYLDGLLAAVMKETNERTKCVICYAAPKDVVFYPCKHRCACSACGAKLSTCPICRTAIAERILPFES
jgi:hypothetical protein